MGGGAVVYSGGGTGGSTHSRSFNMGSIGIQSRHGLALAARDASTQTEMRLGGRHCVH